MIGTAGGDGDLGGQRVPQGVTGPTRVLSQLPWGVPAPSESDSDLQPMLSQVWVSWWKLCMSLMAQAQMQKLQHGHAGSRMQEHGAQQEPQQL